MSRLACLSGPDGRATAPAAGQPAAGAATAGGRSCAVAEERAEQVHGQREDDGGVLVGAELARRSHGTRDETCFRQADGSLQPRGAAPPESAPDRGSTSGRSPSAPPSRRHRSLLAWSLPP